LGITLSFNGLGVMFIVLILWYNSSIGGGIMLKAQTQLKISEFSRLYDILVPEDNELRQINELIDFDFVYDELKDKCNLMIEEKKARETFVSIELYKSEVNHLNKSVDEIKTQNNKILDLLQESK
jgi:hypothetical protein